MSAEGGEDTKEDPIRHVYLFSLEGVFHGNVNTGQLWREIGAAGYPEVNLVYVTLNADTVSISFPYDLSPEAEATLDGICHNHHPSTSSSDASTVVLTYPATSGVQFTSTVSAENLAPGETQVVLVPLHFACVLENFWAMSAASNIGDSFSLSILADATGEVGTITADVAAGATVIPANPSAMAAASTGMAIRLGSSDDMGLVLGRDVAAVPPTITCSRPAENAHASGSSIQISNRLVDKFLIGTSGIINFTSGNTTRLALSRDSYAQLIYTNNSGSETRTFSVALELHVENP